MHLGCWNAWSVGGGGIALGFSAHAAFADGLALQADRVGLTWLLVAVGLVMMMQVGFPLLETGMVRSKNSITWGDGSHLETLSRVESD